MDTLYILTRFEFDHPITSDDQEDYHNIVSEHLEQLLTEPGPNNAIVTDLTTTIHSDSTTE